MQCLNPIICYDKNYYKQSKNGLPIDFFRKRELKGFTNFKMLTIQMGKDKALEELKRPDVFLFPCRKCVNCQLNRSREWAIRNTLESKEYDDSSCLFITLTYDNTHLYKVNYPIYKEFNGINIKTGKCIEVPSLNVRHVQNFIRRLRQEYYSYKIRFFLCGEYGSYTKRPHYHILLYGLPINAIDDLEYKYTNKGYDHYTSKNIEENIWSRGFVDIGRFSEFTAMYVSQYCTKKAPINGAQNYCFANSFIDKLYHSFNTMSRKPGIAHQYYIDHKDDIYKYDTFLYHFDNKTIELKPISYFDSQYDIENPKEMYFIKENRKKYHNNYEYFEQLQTDLSIAEYLNNEQLLKYKKINKRSVI